MSVSDKLKQEYHKIQFILIVIFLAFLPFNAVLQTFFEHRLGVQWLNYFKEIILIFILLINLIWLTEFKLKLKKFIEKVKIASGDQNILIYCLLGYLLLIVLSFLFREVYSAKEFIYGFKYDGLLFICLLAALTLPPKTKEYTYDIIKKYFIAVCSAISIGLFLHFVVGPENLTWLGYRNDWSTFYSNEALAFCQKIENDQTCRFQGTFSGPNQAAANILLALTVGLTLFKHKFLNRRTLIIFSLISLTALFFTFSRSSWLAIILASFVSVILTYRQNLLKIVSSLSLGIIITGIFTLILIPEKILRFESNNERVMLIKDGLTEFMNAPILGQGMGFAGPASHFGNNPIITENWFIQVAINYGLVGLILFIVLYFIVLKNLYLKKEFYFVSLMIGLLIPLNLLHYFEDSSFVYSLFFILGLILSSSQKVTKLIKN